MSVEENKAIVRRYQAALNSNNLDALDEVVAVDIRTPRMLPGFPPGLVGVKWAHQSSAAIFSGWRVTIEDLIAEGDRVAARITMTGVHTGSLGNIPPTGKPIRVPAMYIVRIAEGKIAEHWGMGDDLALMQQLGIRPM